MPCRTPSATGFQAMWSKAIPLRRVVDNSPRQLSTFGGSRHIRQRVIHNRPLAISRIQWAVWQKKRKARQRLAVVHLDQPHRIRTTRPKRNPRPVALRRASSPHHVPPRRASARRPRRLAPPERRKPPLRPPSPNTARSACGAAFSSRGPRPIPSRASSGTAWSY